MLDANTLKHWHVRVVDNGLFPSFARTIAPGFGRVTYWITRQKAFSSVRQLAVGRGFPDIERVKDLWEDEASVDLWCFLDSFQADTQIHLERLGARVWGGRNGEELEHDRWGFYLLCKELGLPTIPSELVTGLPALIARLKERERDKQTPVWVKASYRWGGRADMETWKFYSYAVNRSRLEELAYDLGPAGDSYGFMLQDDMPDAVEIGYDGPTVDGKFPKLAMQAYENKGLSMIGTIRPYPMLAEPLRLVNSKLSPTLESARYRGFFSMENRVGKDLKPYPVDPCCRLGSPSNELLQEMLGNWPLVIADGAMGEMTDPSELYRYGMVAMIYSEVSGKSWQELHYPEKIDRWVKLRNPLVQGRARFSVPQGQPQNLAGVVGVGKTLLEAGAMLGENARQIKGDRIEIAIASLLDTLKSIEEGQRYGMRFGEQPLPTIEQLRKALKA